MNVINSWEETAAATRGGPNEEQVDLDGRAIKAKMGGGLNAEKRDADRQIMQPRVLANLDSTGPQPVLVHLEHSISP